MEPAALSQRQLDALYRLLVPRGVDPEDERTLLKLAVTMSSQLDQTRRTSIPQATNSSNNSADLARLAVSKSFSRCLLASDVNASLTRSVGPRLDVLMALHSDSDVNDGFFMYCLNILGQTKMAEKHAQELPVEELFAINSVLVASGSISAFALSSEVKSAWSKFLLDVLRANLPSSDTMILHTARLVESTDCPDERFSSEFFNFLHLVFHVINHLKLAEPSWIPLLCPAVAICPDGSAAQSKVVSAMSVACGSSQQQSSTYLVYLFDLLLGFVRSLLSTDAVQLSFNDQVQLHSSMSSLIRLATDHFSIWLDYINGKPDVLQFLLEGAITDLPDVPGLFLRLLALCGDNPCIKLKHEFIEQLLDILMYTPTQKVREDASFVIRSVGHSSLIPLLSKRLSRLPSAGIRAEQFALLWATMIKETTAAEINPPISDAVKQFMQLSRDAAKAVAQHPNAYIYRSIGRFLNLAEQDSPTPNQCSNSGSSNNNEKFGYYLEAEPCPICCDKFGDFEMFKVRDVESESKFTHCTRMIRLQGMKSIRSVHIRLEELSTVRSVKTVRLYFNAEKVDSLASLKDKWDRWTLAKSIRVQPWTSDIVISTGTDICAFNILIEFVDFYESVDGSMEIIQCPRCRSPVTTRHGICCQCKENAFQCRQCRNINYEHLDGFLCNECGFCRFAQLQISISARPSFTVASIRNEKDRRHLLDKILCAHAIELQASLDDSASHRADLVSLLQCEPISQGRLCRIYREARSTYRSTCSNYAIVVAARRELLRYAKRSNQAPESSLNLAIEVHDLSNLCYICLKNFVNLSGQVLQILSSSKIVQPVLIASDLLPDLLQQASLSESSAVKDRSRSLLISLCESSENCEMQLYRDLEYRLHLLIDSMSELFSHQALSNYVSILLNICSLDSTTQERWTMRVQAVLRAFQIAVAKGHDSAIVCQHVVVPCLSYLIRLLSRFETQTSVTVSAPKITRKQQLMTGSPSSLSARCQVNSICRKTRRGPDSSSEQKPAIPIKAYIDMLLSASFSSESIFVRSFLLRHHPSWLRASTLYSFSDAKWLRKLILSSASLDARIKSAELIRILCERSQYARDALIPTLIQVAVSIPLGASSVQLFDLFDDLAHRSECKPTMSSPLFLDVFIALMNREVSFLEKGCIEASYPLLGAVSLLHHFSDSVVSVRDSLKCNVSSFVDAFLCLQGFFLSRTKQTQDAAMMLLHIIDEVFSESDADRMTLIRAYIEALGRSHNDIRMSICILEQIDAAVHPNHKNDHCQLLLRKAPSQEEFIRGNMKKTPYSSADLVTMEDLKNKICRDLDLEDAAGMFELLVNGCIIDLSLPIAGVYQKLWKPALAPGSTSIVDYDSDYDDLIIDSSSMVVTYRLKGLDGEATEDIITQLNDESDRVDPAIKYAPLSVVGECGGIALLLSQLRTLKTPFGKDDLESQYAAMSIKTLRYCTYIERNRPFLTPAYHFLLSLLLTVFRSPFSNQYDIQVSNDLLDILATIVDGNVADAVEDVRKITDFLLGHSPLPSAWPRLASLLPGITRGLHPPAQVLLQSFIPHLNWEAIDNKQKPIFPAECFAFVAESLTFSSPEVFFELRSLASTSVVPASYDYLQSIETQPSIASHESLPYALRILTGLVKGFEKSQIAALPIIPFLHRLERITSSNKVGPLAENLLEALCENCPNVVSVVQKLRNDTRNSRKKAALAKRKKLLDQLGLQPCGKAPASVLGMESVSSDPGLTCMVCQEGYAYKPRDMLGFYVFDKEANLNNDCSAKDESIGLTTVTHFNTIHYSCHSDAAGADRRKKPPKSEWEGATLRNAHTLCNNIFPILHKSSSLDEYALRCDDYWRNIPFRSAFQMQKVEILLHNLRLLLARFAQDKSFSEHSKGGGRQSNIRFIPYLIQLGAFLMISSPSDVKTRLRKAVMHSISEPEEQWMSMAFSDGSSGYSMSYAMEYNLVSGLLVLKPDEWQRERHTFLRRLIIFSRKSGPDKDISSPPSKKRRTSSSSSKQASEPDECVLECVRPSLIFYLLVDFIHECLVKFEPDAASNNTGNSWDRLLRYIRHRHQDMLLSLDEFCQTLSTKILTESNLDNLLTLCNPNMLTQQSGENAILSLWSLADSCNT